MSSSSRIALFEYAPAKVNLTLRIVGRRRDGYHTLESLVAFASIGDRLRLDPSGTLSLIVRGPFAAQTGAMADNLVLRAARALATELPRLRLGRFTLIKNVPAAGGLGGGSADAAAALRLLARANRLMLGDPRLIKVARKLGADVPVCLDSHPRLMRGIGEILSSRQALPRLSAVLVNPGVALATAAVFARFDKAGPAPRRAGEPRKIPAKAEAFVDYLAARGNDLEPAAIALQPEVASALSALRALSGCELARMSGSGATCFGLFVSARAAASAARSLRTRHRGWWVRAAVVG